MHNQSNRRKNFRVEDTIQLSDQPLTRGEMEIRKWQCSNLAKQSLALRDVLGDGSGINFGGLEGVDTETLKGLDILNAKLDFIIGLLSDKRAQESRLTRHRVNISAGGISFITKHDYCTDDFIEMEIMLPLFPPVFLNLLGRVRKVTASREGHLRIGVEFLFRTHSEERAIAQYVFQRHRETIRLQKNKELEMRTAS